MPLSKREANKERCRKDILKASRRLFKAKGYENTIIEEVAEKACISKATLYNYFPNKDSLLLGTLEEVTEGFQKYVRENLKEEQRNLEKLRKSMIYLIVDTLPFLSVSRRILWLDAKQGSAMYKKSATIKNLLGEMIEQSKEEGDLKKEIPTETISDLLMGIYLASQFQWTDIDNMTEEQCAERVSQVFDLTLAGCKVE